MHSGQKNLSDLASLKGQIAGQIESVQSDVSQISETAQLLEVRYTIF